MNINSLVNFETKACSAFPLAGLFFHPSIPSINSLLASYPTSSGGESGNQLNQVSLTAQAQECTSQARPDPSILSLFSVPAMWLPGCWVLTCFTSLYLSSRLPLATYCLCPVPGWARMRQTPSCLTLLIMKDEPWTSLPMSAHDKWGMDTDNCW